MKIFKNLFAIAALTISFAASASLVNLQHLDHLYEERTIESGEKLGLIHIYSEYPDYEWVKDPLEGVSALDDMARAIVVYSDAYQQTKEKAHFEKMTSLINSILFLHSDNGYFNNFIYPDNTVNTTYKTSLANANWWTWRAIWALSYTYEQVLADNKELAEKMHTVLFKSIDTTYEGFNFEQTVTKQNGFDVPEWLPSNGADQASVLLLGLTKAYQIAPSEKIAKLMKSLADGIMLMQVKNVESPIYGAMLSWKNIWHAYGNSQSYALLEAGMALEDRDMVKAAFEELDHFYPYLIEQGHLNWFSAEQKGKEIKFLEKDQFAQIAYGFRPMIFASLRAFEISRDSRYIDQAVKLAMWFFKDNAGAIQMYSPETGRGYDGLNSATEYNRNSGAESTIEALLSLAAIEKSPKAKKLLQEKLKALKVKAK
ncbi:hypothetical protein [Psychromonas ossibalaenae]|uniref:hypothetical protein n=1 Tax=Psychromonas ossibalaenae TaxID=444922 RepID=UPI00047823CB|nr:hypothetical protein [Psychromonas ossibalaenae]